MDNASQPTTVVRRRRSRSKALRLAFEYEQSGLTRRAFCHQHDLSPASLDSYRRLRSQHSAAGQSSTSDLNLVPVELIDRASPIQPSASDAGIYLVLSSGRRIGFASGFDAATLTRLVSLLDEV